MSKLAELQSQFVAFLQGHESSLPQLVSDQPPVATSTRLAIYHNAYRVRLRETIDNDHPILGLYLGDELYDKLVANYIIEYPSQVKSLRHFCASLPKFLRDNAPFSDHPILTKLAEFERLLLASFDAKDQQSLELSDLANVAPDAWPMIKLSFHPSCTVFSQQVNAVETWQALKSATPPPKVQSSQLSVYWLVWRNQQRLTEFYNLDPREQALWQLFKQGGDFSAGCELLAQYYPSETVPVEAIKILQHWLNNGLITRISV